MGKELNNINKFYHKERIDGTKATISRYAKAHPEYRRTDTYLSKPWECRCLQLCKFMKTNEAIVEGPKHLESRR